MKIAIIGHSGAGKSTLAKELSNYYNCPLLYLDKIQFEANWKSRDKTKARKMVKDFMLENESWVIDGNYSDFYQSERLEEADQILFLNFSRFNCLWRAYKRYKKYKNQTRESASPGCDEKLDWTFIKWILFESRTSKRKKHFKQITEDYSTKVFLLKNQNEIDLFLRDLCIYHI